jgi:hypothetical protein
MGFCVWIEENRKKECRAEKKEVQMDANFNVRAEFWGGGNQMTSTRK